MYLYLDKQVVLSKSKLCHLYSQILHSFKKCHIVFFDKYYTSITDTDICITISTLQIPKAYSISFEYLCDLHSREGNANINIRNTSGIFFDRYFTCITYIDICNTISTLQIPKAYSISFVYLCDLHSRERFREEELDFPRSPCTGVDYQRNFFQYCQWAQNNLRGPPMQKTLKVFFTYCHLFF